VSVCDVLAWGALVNRREADALRQVLSTLEHGPGAGWAATLVGRELGPWSPAEHKRILDLDLWLGTWIRPTLRNLLERFRRQSSRASVGRSRRARSDTGATIAAARIRRTG
jgi:hypothetical protein